MHVRELWKREAIYQISQIHLSPEILSSLRQGAHPRRRRRPTATNSVAEVLPPQGTTPLTQTDPRRKCLTLILQGSFCRFLVMIDTMICTHKLYTELVMASQFGAYSFITKHSMILICYHLVIFLYQVPLNKVRLNLCGCLLYRQCLKKSGIVAPRYEYQTSATTVSRKFHTKSLLLNL